MLDTIIGSAAAGANVKKSAKETDASKMDESMNITHNVIDHSDIQLESKEKMN